MVNYKKYFPWFTNNKGWVYADSAATSLKPKVVTDAIVRYYTHFSTNPHNNDSKIASQTNTLVRNARKNIASFLNCLENEVIFTSGATDGLNLITHNVSQWLKKGDEVVVSYGEHASNLLPWISTSNTRGIKLVYAGDKASGITTEGFLEKITKKTAVVSFSASSNILGYDINIKKIVEKCRRINKSIIIIVDGTQYITHERINIKKLDIDFFVCSSHKLCGPSGIGIMYGRERYLDKMHPLRLGGGMNVTMDEKGYIPHDGPSKFEGGTPHTEGIIGTDVAIKFLLNIGYKNIQKKLISLKKYFDKKIKEVNDIIYPNVGYKYPIIAFNIKGCNPQDIACYLGSKKIIVRGGLSCVKLMHMINDNKAGFVRVSLSFYNDYSDIDKIIQVLKTFKRGVQLNYLL